jgi:hypothetical protein
VLVVSDLDFRECFSSSPPRFGELCAFTTHDPTAAVCSDAMHVNFLAPFQAILRPKSQFALFFVSYFTAKLLHLGSHAGSLPILLYLLYFPTFLLPDFLLLVGSKILVYRHNGGQASTIRRSLGAFLA